MKRAKLFGAMVVLLSLSIHSRLSAAGTVLYPTDADLRAALAGGGAVTFACDGTIALTNVLVITNDTTVDGSGHSITISGGNAVRLFSVSSGVTASFINLTLANGYVAGSNGVAGPPLTDGQPGMGGAILNNGGTAALTGCTVVSNNAVGGAGYTSAIYPTNSTGGVALGGAIYNLAGSLSVTNCGFSANGVTGGTGGNNRVYGAAGGDARGGAIYSQGGSVTVQNSAFVLNTIQGGAPGYAYPYPGQAGSGFGGAVWSSGATVNFYNSTFTSNLVVGADSQVSSGTGGAGSGEGGAVFASSGVVNYFGCTFSTNTAIAGFKQRYGFLGLAQGGAIWSQASSLVSQCSFFGNQTVNKGGSWVDYSGGEGSGGAIFNGNMLSLSGSSFAQNKVKGADGNSVLNSPYPGGNGKGGALCNQGTLTATNCTFVANSAVGGAAAVFNGWPNPVAGGNGVGGGLFNVNGTATLVNLTFASNNAAGGAGANQGQPVGSSLGGAICSLNGTVNLYNTIVAGSTSGSNCFGTLTDLGHNLSSDTSCNFTGPGSLNNTDPILSPLDNYGGPTLTMALLTGSPAIDGGDPVSYPPTDQRGHARPFGSAPDIGAFESSPPFVIRGSVSGATLRDEVSLIAGTTTVSTVNHSYSLEGLAANSYAVTPSSPYYLFLPNNRAITVGSDQLGVNFKAYHWNALSLDDVTNSTIHVIFAGTNGQSYRLQTSTNLLQWSSVLTNTMGPSDLWEMFLPVNSSGSLFYRTATP